MKKTYCKDCQFFRLIDPQHETRTCVCLAGRRALPDFINGGEKFIYPKKTQCFTNFGDFRDCKDYKRRLPWFLRILGLK